MTARAAAATLALVVVALVGRARESSARAEPKAKAAGPCVGEGPVPGAGSLDPFRAPAGKALELNAAGLVPYRQGKWEEARAQYRAALAADPEFLAPRLNIASSFVREERFGEATAEVVALLDRAYVPWAREIREAADLGALRVRPEMKEIQRAMAASAAKWGEGLDVSVLFVARQRTPLKIPGGPGVFILNPHQEVWAYSPQTERYRQLTAEDGHVVALARSPDGRRILYVTAEKLVRGARPGDEALRGVAVHELELATMTASPAAPIEGDLGKLEIFSNLSLGLPERRQLVRDNGAGALVGAAPSARAGRPVVTLTAAGVAPVPRERFGNACPLPEAATKASSGAALAGLPIP
jgi:hypothetical protein